MKKLTLLIIILFSINFSFAQEQEKLSEKEKARRQHNIDIGNPFARFGYKPKIATLSKGKYLEFHDRDSIVKIGSFTYNTRQKIVTGFIDLDTVHSEATLRPELISRWFNPDPLSDEFPSWSPYNFVKNNPIRFIDPDGRAPEDWFVNSKTGALVFIKGTSTLNQTSVNNAFGTTMASVIFSNENKLDNWNRLGGDTMFDTKNNKISETLTHDYKSSFHSEEFANKHGLIKSATNLIEKQTAEVFTSFGQEERNRETLDVSTKLLASDISYSNPSEIGKTTTISEKKVGNRMELLYTTKVYTEVVDYHSQNKGNSDKIIEKTINVGKIVKDIIDAFK